MLKVSKRTIKGYEHYMIEGSISFNEVDDFYDYSAFNSPYKVKKKLLEEVSETIDDIILNHKREVACTRFVIIEKIGYLNKYQVPNKAFIEHTLSMTKII